MSSRLQAFAWNLLTHVRLRYFVRSEEIQHVVRENHHGKRANDILDCCFQGSTPLSGISPEYECKYQWCKSARETSRQYRAELRQEYCKAESWIMPASNIRKYTRYCAHSETLIRRSNNFFVQPNTIRVFGNLQMTDCSRCQSAGLKPNITADCARQG